MFILLSLFKQFDYSISNYLIAGNFHNGNTSSSVEKELLTAGSEFFAAVTYLDYWAQYLPRQKRVMMELVQTMVSIKYDR